MERNGMTTTPTDVSDALSAPTPTTKAKAKAGSKGEGKLEERYGARFEYSWHQKTSSRPTVIRHTYCTLVACADPTPPRCQ